MDLLHCITDLSHEFGTDDYVRAGGGNTSAKDETTLWVKPSGTTLSTLKPESFVAMDRQKLSELYAIQTPADPSARETLVKDKMAAAVLSETGARASVEAPLHDSLTATFVVHTHPAAVNGMTCAINGKSACKDLFPNALWLDYIDPGYTLCMEVRSQIQNYKAAYGQEPEVIFLKNHGVFIAADTPEAIRTLYADMMNTLAAEYEKANISMQLDIAPLPDQGCVSEAKKTILKAAGDDTLHVQVSGMFDYATGPISPDHIVYSKSYPYTQKPTPEGMAAFQSQHGYIPQVMSFDDMVFGVCATEKKATLALELAQDGALVQKLAEAFGGIDYMTDAAREFIENWEVESYRSKQL